MTNREITDAQAAELLALCEAAKSENDADGFGAYDLAIEAREAIPALLRDRAVMLADMAEAQARYKTRGKLLVGVRDALINIRDELDDQDDLVAFGSTNHADQFRDAVEELNNEYWRIFLAQEEGEKDAPNYIAVNRKLHERAIAAEAERDRLRKELHECRLSAGYPTAALKGSDQ